MYPGVRYYANRYHLLCASLQELFDGQEGDRQLKANFVLSIMVTLRKWPVQFVPFRDLGEGGGEDEGFRNGGG